MAAPNIRIDIASEFKDRGFKQASKASTNLDRQFKKLARTFATVFSVTAITRFGKQAVKAFEEDEAAARRLTQTLTNLGMAFEDPNVGRFISELEGATGVLDDDLRPAMSRLLTTTASFVKSQELLALAIDVSRGSGVALQTVVSDLSRAYVGQTRGLTKYGTGLTTVELQTKSFTEIQQILSKQFGGQSQAYLETYSGKISLLNVAYANMSETIGESLVDAMLMAAGQDGIAGLTAAMEDFGDEMADVIRGVGVLLSVLDRIPGVQAGGIAGAITSPFGVGLKVLAELGKRSDKTLFFPTAGIGQPAIDKQREAIEKARIKREKELERLRKKAAAQAAKREREAQKREREQQALKRAGTVFDMESIQIVAAMQGRIDGEQRLRLTALLAIQNQNADAAEKLSTAVLATNSAALQTIGVTMKAGDSVDDVIKKIINSQAQLALVQLGITNLPKAKNPFEDWKDIMSAILSDIGRISAAINAIPKYNPTGSNYVNPSTTTRPNVAGAPPAIDGGTQWNFLAKEHTDAIIASAAASQMTDVVVDELTKRATMATLAANAAFTGLAEFKAREYGDIIVNVNVGGNVTTQSDLVDIITDQLYQNQKTGKGLLFSSTAI